MPGSAFMDEFYAECEDHFVEVRKALMALEGKTGNLDPALFATIFQRYHSLKGICGMAGLQEAEKLAHRTEDYLRVLSRGDKELTNRGFDTLSTATQGLELLVAAHRTQQKPPAMTGLFDELNRLLGNQPAEAAPTLESALETAPPVTPAPPAGEDAVQGRVRRARAQGFEVQQFTFTPSPELNDRGVNVNAIRTRLQAVGELIHSAPHIQAGGAVTFEFLVAGKGPLKDVKEWGKEGVTVRAYEASSAPATTTASPDPLRTGASVSVAPSHFVRVDLGRLDELMRVMGEMVASRARLDDMLTRISKNLPTADGRALQEVSQSFSRELRHLRDGLMRVRLVPIGEIFDRMPFVVRELAGQSGKQVRLRVEGQDTEIDKYLVERLKDPLLHLVRNAVSHGIEEPRERLAGGKPAEGTLSLRASTSGEMVVIEVVDDGRGINPEQIAARAQAHGLFVPADLTPVALLDLLCAPGFSTRAEADLGAGRGVGMAAVKTAVAELGGILELSSEAGKGTTFSLRLPLTLSVADALIITAGGQKFAVPQALVREITTASPAALKGLERNEVMTYRDGVLPIIRLASFFGLTGESRKEFPVLVVGTGLTAVGLLADRVLGQREIVVRTVSDPLLKVPAIAGATELGDGRAVLILDSNALIESTRSGKKRDPRSLNLRPTN